MVSGAALAEALAAEPGPLVLLVGESPSSAAEVEVMTRLLKRGASWRAQYTVTDALKAVEEDVITGTIDRRSTVVLRLPASPPR